MGVAADLRDRLRVTLQRAPSAATLCVAGAVALWLMYAFVFSQTTGEPLGACFIYAAANVLPLALLAIATHAILKTHVMQRSVPLQALLHLMMAVTFATLWYGTILVMLAFFNGMRGGGFAVRGFSGPAFTWQVFQGLILYAGVAATCYALRGGREAAQLTMVAAAPAAAPSLHRYLVKQGDDIRPMDVRDIITITGAQDYSEVVTRDGAHLVRMSLSEFEKRLDPTRFLRVHRSTILHLDHLVSVEPAGSGRMLAHMDNGHRVSVSRAGVLALRAFIV